MRPLVAVRRAAPFDRDFARRSPLFWPVARASAVLGDHADFPPVEALARVFDGEAPVRFVPAAPRRRRGGPVDPGALYDARVTVDGVVPTRARCWHDLMNALVWGTFPAAKRALHARQHRVIAARITPGARALPAARTPELDALALLDEGGVVLLASDPAAVQADLRRQEVGPPRRADASSARDVVVFGHAVYESLVLGVAPAVVAAVVLPRPDASHGLDGAVRATDEALARVIEDEARLRDPGELVRLDLDALHDARAGLRTLSRTAPCGATPRAASRPATASESAG